MYRVFELNPITNEWIDRGYVEGKSQQAAIKAHNPQAEGQFFAVPESSYHPVNVGKKEVVRWTYTAADGSEAQGVAEESLEPAEVDG